MCLLKDPCIIIYIDVHIFMHYCIPLVWILCCTPICLGCICNITLIIYRNIHDKWIFIWLLRTLGYKNIAVRLNVGPAEWTTVLTDNYGIIKTVVTHYEMFAWKTDYITNIIKAYLAVQHFTFLLPHVNIDHLCRNWIFLCLDNLFTK